MKKDSKNEKMGTQNIANISEAIRLHQQKIQQTKREEDAPSNEEKGTSYPTITTQKINAAERTFRVCANMPQDLHKRIRDYQYAQSEKVTIEDFLIAATVNYLERNNF